MLNFDTPLDIAGVSRLVVQPEAAPSQARTIESKSYLLTPEGAWSWQQLRDYVVGQIEARFGPFARDFTREHAIWKSFVNRWGDKAPAIAKYAFEVEGGYWLGQPITVTRFCKGGDPYFAMPIAERVSQPTVVPW